MIGYVTYPILGRRAPLLGYYVRTQNCLRHGSGRCINLKQPPLTETSTPSVEFQPDIFVAIIPRARSLYDCGVIVSPDHRLLADVSWEGYGLISEPQCHPAMYKLCLPPIQHIQGRVAVITSIKPDNYYHWMFDILPRFEIVLRSGLVPDYYLINATTQFQKESLQILNIPSHQVLSPTHVRISKLTSSLFRHCPDLFLACRRNLERADTCVRLSFKAPERESRIGLCI